MTPITLGMRFRDNDPREQEHARVLEVVDVTTKMATEVRSDGFCTRFVSVQRSCAILQRGPKDAAHRTSVRLDRLHTDGKPCRTGWSLVPGPQQPAQAVSSPAPLSDSAGGVGAAVRGWEGREAP